jgi:hypothetical protein
LRVFWAKLPVVMSSCAITGPTLADLRALEPLHDSRTTPDHCSGSTSAFSKRYSRGSTEPAGGAPAPRDGSNNPSGTIKSRMGATHFLMKTLPRVASEMALHVLAYNLTRVMNIMGVQLLLATIGA